MSTVFNNNTLVDYLTSINVLYRTATKDAFYAIDRANFITDEMQEYAYSDSPLSIGYSQTISQPYVVAFMMELLDVQKGNSVLDIGSGSAYTTCILSSLAGSEGNVIGLERIEELIKFGKDNLDKYNLSHAQIIQANTNLGIKDKTFDRILVSAAAQSFPKELLLQLKEGGRLVIPIKGSIFLFVKEHDEITSEEHRGFTFVPLIYDEV